MNPPDGMRLDKWLWAARFFKTRALAVEAIDKGRVQLNGQAAKSARELHAGDLVELRQGPLQRTLQVRGLSLQRGPAVQAQQLYAETAESVERARRHTELMRQGVEPAQALTQGRPTKRDRRDLADWRRWSAAVDDA